MNQTRVFLIFAWLMVAVLLWMEWGKQQAAPAPQTTTEQAALVPTSTTPASVPGAAAGAVPQAQATGGDPAEAPQVQAATAQRVSVTTDVLHLTLDGSNVLQAELLKFPQTRDEGSPPVRLFDQSANIAYTAGSDWVTTSGATATSVFVPAKEEHDYVLANGQDEVQVPFVSRSPEGVEIRRTFTFKRGQYAVEVRDEVTNAGSDSWQGHVYRKLQRSAPQIKRGMTNPGSFSFHGATWFSPEEGYERRMFDEDYIKDGELNRTVTGGWIAFLEHHFFTSWVPQADQGALFVLSKDGSSYQMEARGPGFTLAPGQQAESTARLWVGPKLVDAIAEQHVKGLDRVVDYSRFSILALLGQGLFWVLNILYGFIGNWGWAIIGLVVLLKIALFPLASAQYKSFAKMRKFQPRLQQLKERYGDDKQKYQQAMMELYKKEKINPMGGCLPILIQMPIFLALYWVLVESVELRHAPWIWWIQDLTARDPYFILPVLNAAVMWFTQKLTPTQAGMDPMQQKIFQMMPLIFGVMMAFMPAGLVLYWLTNGALGLLQQWWITRKYEEAAPAKA